MNYFAVTAAVLARMAILVGGARPSLPRFAGYGIHTSFNKASYWT